MDQPNGTPRSRPLLKFANRVYTSSPQGGAKRFGSPSATNSSRRPLDRGTLPPSALDRTRMDAASNIFRASSLGTSTTRFEPAIPSGTARRLFAPAATPVPKKVQRTIKTPGGTKLKTNEKDLFEMRIPSPPPELSGEAITQRLPKDIDDHSHVYADQYAADLCPKGFTDEQRRQFFCILDLRRLKYAANEIFARKDWRVNVMNFAKEYEKSRSLIMLRYGLYEFKNVKPSEEVLRKWRVAHGLEVEPAPSETPTKKSEAPKGTKRKAEEELHPKDTALSASSANPNKRKLMEKETMQAPAVPSPTAKKPLLGRQSEPDENQPSSPTQEQTTQPSTTKSLFEKIAGGTSTPAKPKPSIFGSTLAPNPFPATAKPAPNGAPPRSVFEKDVRQSTSSGNIFGYLSDAGSAQNSGVDADGESETDSEQDAEEHVAASGGANTPNVMPAAPSLFTVKKTGSSGHATGPSSISSDAKESSNSLSLFDRITKGNDGQPVRVQEEPAEEAPVEASSETPANKTWDPATPIKFAPSAASAPGGPTSNIFGQKPGLGASVFGGFKPTKEASPAPAISSSQNCAETDKSISESDKENTAQPKFIFGASTTTPAPTSSSSSLFKAAEKKDATGAAPLSAAASMFKAVAEKKDAAESKPDGASSKSEPAKASDTSTPSSMFGTGGSGAGNIFGAKQPMPNGSVSQQSTLFGSKPATNEAPMPSPLGQKPGENTAKPTASLFGSSNSATAFVASADAPKSNIFGSSTSAAPKSSMFESAAATTAPTPSTTAAPTSSLFGSTATSNTSASTPSLFVSAPATTESEAPKPSSSLFGTSATTAPSNSLFGQPKPSLGGAPSFTFGKPAGDKSPDAELKPANALFGSPMKQDGPSPGKRSFGDAMQEDSPVRKKQFGQSSSSLFGSQNATPSQPATSAPFTFSGIAPSAPAAPPAMFGGNSQASKIDFNFGGASSTPGVAAPLFGGSSQPAKDGFVFSASGNGASSGTPTTGANGGEPNLFAFSASASTPQKGPGGRPIKRPNFGATKAAAQRAALASSMAPSPVLAPSTGSLFGNPVGATAAPSAPTFTFGGTPSTQPPQGQQTPGSLFGIPQQQQGGNLFGGLQPPQGGASTTGTNSPFNFGGASSLATTPATGTPEPQTDPEVAASSNAPDGDGEPPQAQLNLTEGGPGEEDETTVHEVRAKVLKFVPPSTDGDDSDSKKGGAAKSPWTTKGVGPLRLLKHKESNNVRMLLRTEPAGVVALNRLILPNFNYRSEKKYVKLTTSDDTGSGLETWMVQVKTEELAKELANALEANKAANKS